MVEGHNAEVFDIQHLSDEQIAVGIWCCQDETTKSYNTISITPGMAETDIETFINTQKDRVSAQHDAITKAKSFLEAQLPQIQISSRVSSVAKS